MIRLFKLTGVLFFCVFMVSVSAQQLPINIESLSDQQLIQLIGQYQLAGLSETELEMKAREKGLSVGAPP